MCILCVVQRWSRRVATMLPWLVIPLIILWALSQLLPPALRFEITSPRLACVLVLLATLFWYEILMPHLSSWRARRSARLRERRRTEALELQKLRKTATRRCRNCNMPYRDQNPGGGRFMCSYCGHISRRPALDLPDQIESTGMFPDVVGKNGWLCYADGHGNWVGPSQKHWNGSEHLCPAKRSDSGLNLFACKLLFYFVSSARWLHGKFLTFGSAREDVSSDSDHRGLSSKGEDGVNFHESRGEKARRKAEEKRQARLEKEMLEEEEKKQREEVARLVEERRRLRDELLAAETERSKGSTVNGDRDGRKEMNKRKKDKRKDKDKASSKSNSDGEELDRRTSREIERKQEFEKKAENEWRDLHKGVLSSNKSHALAGVYGSKVGGNNSRYFDRVKGSFLYTSKGFGGPFFGRNVQNTATVTKSIKLSSGYIDHSQNSANKSDAHFVVHAVGKAAFGTGGKASEANLNRRAATNVQPKEANVKKSWQQLFTRSSVVSPDPDAISTNQGNPVEHLSYRGDQPFNKNFLPSYSTIDNQVDYVKSLPNTTYPLENNSVFHNLPDTPFSPLEETSRSSVSEDADLFEDPCYVPDPISLLGPVSESLDNFPSNSETGFCARNKCEGSSYLMNVLTSSDVNKPSPIEPPLPKSHFPEGKHFTSDNPNSDVSSNIPGESTWQMWGSPLSQEGIGLIGRPSNWFSPLVQCNSQQQDIHKPICQPISKNNNALSGLSTQHAHIGKQEQTCGTYSPLGPGFVDNGIWQQKPPFQSPPRVDGDRLLPLDLMDNFSQIEAPYSSPMKSTTVNPFSSQPANCWSREMFDEAGNQSREMFDEAGKQSIGGENTGSFFSRGPDVASVWSFT